MQTRSWEPTAKDYQFMRDNVTLISPQTMADHFKVPIGILNREKTEMGLIIDDEVDGGTMATAEYALDRWLNRLERAMQWSIGVELLNCCKGFERRIA